MFGNILSVANDSDKILEASDNWSYVRDDKCNSDKIFKESNNIGTKFRKLKMK